jgi:hypothetical protein
MTSFPTVDESYNRLHRSGWSIGDARILTAEGLVWSVNGSNRENSLSGQGRTQAEAWHQAARRSSAGRGREISAPL